MSNKQHKQRYAWYKAICYLTSLWLLFILVFLLTIRGPHSNCTDTKLMDSFRVLLDWICQHKWGELWKWICQNWLAFLSLFYSLFAYCCAWLVHENIEATTARPPHKITEIESVNFEYLTFMTSFIMPLVCFDFNNPRYVLVFFVLLFVLGFIFIKMDLYYGNPTLAFMGYRLYRAHIESSQITEPVILITKNELRNEMFVLWLPLDKHIWIAKDAGKKRKRRRKKRSKVKKS